MSDAMQWQAAPRMTVDDFLGWAEDRPERYELIDGRPVAMAPEQAGHARAKLRVHQALDAAIRAAAVTCEVFPDGMTVRIDEATAFEPDASVSCGPRLSKEAVEIPAPSIVVDVISPSTASRDRHDKLAGYFAVRSIAHYLILDIDKPMLIHHARDGADIRTRILGGAGPLRLDPPGLDLRIEDLLDQE